AELAATADVDALDRLRLAVGVRPHAQPLKGIDAGPRQGEVAFVVTRLRADLRQRRLDQRDAVATAIQRDGQTRSDQAAADDDDVVTLAHCHMIVATTSAPA